MPHINHRQLIFSLLLVFIILIGLFFNRSSFGIKNKCEVSLKSDSNVLNVNVVDSSKLYKFVNEYLPCKNSKFTYGYPNPQKGPFEASKLVIIINDKPKSSGKYFGNEKNIRAVGWDYKTIDNSLILEVGYNESFINKIDINKDLIYTLTLQLNALENYDNLEKQIERNPELMKNYEEYNLEKAGLEVSKL